MCVTNIHRELINGPEPSHGELSGESIVPEEDVGDSATGFGARQPRGDEGVDGRKIRLNDKRTAGDQDDNAFHLAADIGDHARAGFRNRQVQAVAVGLRVR